MKRKTEPIQGDLFTTAKESLARADDAAQDPGPGPAIDDAIDSTVCPSCGGYAVREGKTNVLICEDCQAGYFFKNGELMPMGEQ